MAAYSTIETFATFRMITRSDKCLEPNCDVNVKRF